MADTVTAQGRVNLRSEYENVRYAVMGTAVGVPERAVERPDAQKKASARVLENREKALVMNAGYVVFLLAAAVATVWMCVRYLQLKETITAQVSANERLESQLVTLRSENDALYENVHNETDWNAVRDRAINEFGMKYAQEDQIVWYNVDDSCYIRQYGEVPAD